jgi:multicomponent Na+:H+ antiporter subunit F
MTMAALIGFVIAGTFGVYRLLTGPSLADRVAALDVALISLMGAVTVDAARRDDPTYLITLMVLAIIGFTTTVATSRFIEHNSGVAAGEQADEQPGDQPEGRSAANGEVGS